MAGTMNATATIPQSLARMFQRLDAYEQQVPLEVLERELRALELDPKDIPQYITFSEERYQRNRIHVGPGYHALILCWEPGQESMIHNHAGSFCGLKILQGTAGEIVFERGADGLLKEVGKSTFNRGEVCVSIDKDIHLMNNVDDEEGLITLHIYTPPMMEFQVYERGSPDVKTWVDPVSR